MPAIVRTLFRLLFSSVLVGVLLLLALLVFFAILLGIPVVTGVTAAGAILLGLAAVWGIVRIWRGPRRDSSVQAPGVSQARAQEHTSPGPDDPWAAAIAEQREFTASELFEYQASIALRNAAALAVQRNESEPTAADIAEGGAMLKRAQKSAVAVERRLALAMKRWDKEFSGTGRKDGPASLEVAELAQMYEFYLSEAGEINLYRDWKRSLGAA